jgi:UDP-N-acetylmuramoyl-tripeptide--D-alanyl-D-alanine ligase
LLERFGGHAAAAGFLVQSEKVAELRSRLEQLAWERLEAPGAPPPLQIDAVVAPFDINRQLIEFLDRLEPLGSGFPPPLLGCLGMTVIDTRPVGRDKSHLKLVLRHRDRTVDAIAFRGGSRPVEPGTRIDLAFYAEREVYMGLEGIRFRLHFRNEVIYLRVPMIGRHSVHTALRAAAVGLVEGLAWQEIALGLRTSHSQLRLVAVNTENGALILDDTYNASPESTLAALNLLDELEGRKIAVLGDMLELGVYEQQGHEMVGVRAAEIVDELVAVGERSQLTARAAERSGLKKRKINWFKTSGEALAYLENRLKQGDIVLVKGSRGMRMDVIVAALESRS